MPQLSLTPLSYAVLATTIAVSLWQFRSPEGFTRRWALSTRAVLEERQHARILTHGFLHAGLFHLFVNMVTLFFFGPPIESVLGSDGFAVVYFGSIAAGAIASLVAHRKNPDYWALGASGGVSGLVFSFVLFAPLQNFYIFFIPIGVPAYIFAPAYLLYSVVAMGGRSNVGHEAHIGGALTGAALTILMRPEVVPNVLRQLGLA